MKRAEHVANTPAAWRERWGGASGDIHAKIMAAWRVRMNTIRESQPRRAVCVYCASSQTAHPEYREAAFRLGAVLAEQQLEVVYGGGARGSMGALADGALSRGGRVVGVLPKFM